MQLCFDGFGTCRSSTAACRSSSALRKLMGSTSESPQTCASRGQGACSKRRSRGRPCEHKDSAGSRRFGAQRRCNWKGSRRSERCRCMWPKASLQMYTADGTSRWDLRRKKHSCDLARALPFFCSRSKVSTDTIANYQNKEWSNKPATLTLGIIPMVLGVTWISHDVSGTQP